MHGSLRSLAIAVVLGGAGSLHAQNHIPFDPPRPYVVKQPPTRQEIEHRQSLHQFVRGLALEREDRFAEALKAFEESARLDPDATAPVRAQVRILLLADRLQDALEACKTVLRLDPGDFSVWYTRGKIHRTLADYPAAIAALERGTRSDRLKENPAAAHQVYFELGSLHESIDQPGPAAAAYARAAEILDQTERILAKVAVPRAAVEARATETCEKIAALYRKAKQYPEAIASLRKAQGHTPDQTPRLSYEIAKLHAEAGQPKEALPHVEAYLRTQPLNVDAYELKTGLLVKLKQEADILPWLEAAAQRDRFNTSLHLLLGKEYLRARQLAKAEPLFNKLIAEEPTPELYRGLFHVYRQQGLPGMEKILTMLNNVMVGRDDPPASASQKAHARAIVGALREDSELGKGLVDIAFQVGARDPALKFDTVYLLAVLADRHRKTEEAERFYRQCLPRATPANEAVIYSGLLRTLNKARKYEEVVTLCRTGLKSAKATNPLLFYNDQARAEASLHRYEAALKTTERGATQAGDDNQFLFKTLRVRILSMAERFDEAETECKALMKTHAKSSEAVELRYLLSNIYSAAKQQARAEEELQHILKIDPDHVTVNNDLGYLWADQGKNLAAAEEMIRRALELDRAQRKRNPNYTVEEDRDNSAYVDSLGWVLFRRGQVEEARKELERAITLGEDDPVIFDHLGDVYQRLNRQPEAVRAWRRSLELYEQGLRRKDDERVRDIQRKIKQATAP